MMAVGAGGDVGDVELVRQSDPRVIVNSDEEIDLNLDGDDFILPPSSASNNDNNNDADEDYLNSLLGEPGGNAE